MATTNDPRAANFNATAFRDAIRFVMTMGLPDSTAEKATFQWRPEKNFTYESPTGAPYDWTATPVASSQHVDVVVPVAVEFSGNVSGVTTANPVGNFENPYAVITMLDTDHELVEGANVVLLGGNTYFIRYTEPPIGLFEVTVFRLHLQAQDES